MVPKAPWETPFSGQWFRSPTSKTSESLTPGSLRLGRTDVRQVHDVDAGIVRLSHVAPLRARCSAHAGGEARIRVRLGRHRDELPKVVRAGRAAALEVRRNLRKRGIGPRNKSWTVCSRPPEFMPAASRSSMT